MTDPSLLHDHTRRTGEIICVLCCESYPRALMQPVSDEPGKVWDVCRTCAALDIEQGGKY